MVADMDWERSVVLRLRWNWLGSVFADSDDRRPYVPPVCVEEGVTVVVVA